MNYTYLAIAYAGREDQSYEYSKRALASYLRAGRLAYSPITHSHATAHEYGQPSAWEHWERISLAMVSHASSVDILVPAGWLGPTLRSTGVRAEVKHALDLGKPINVLTLRLRRGTWKHYQAGDSGDIKRALIARARRVLIAKARNVAE